MHHLFECLSPRHVLPNFASVVKVSNRSVATHLDKLDYVELLTQWAKSGSHKICWSRKPESSSPTRCYRSLGNLVTKFRHLFFKWDIFWSSREVPWCLKPISWRFVVVRRQSLQDYDCWDAKFYKIMVVGMQVYSWRVGSWSYCFHQVTFKHILDNTN
jgi:hypothetical protein